MARLALAFLCGMLLCGMRAPLGTDLLAFPAVSSGEAYAARSLGLAAVAAVVLLARRSLDGRSNADLLFGATLGYLTEGLLGELHREATSSTFILAPVALVALILRERKGHPEDPQPPATTPLVVPVFLGAGLALALDGLSRSLRLLGRGGPLDDNVTGVVLLATATFGAVAFGRPLQMMKSDRARGVTLTIAALVAGILMVLSYETVRGLADPRGFKAYLARFGLDPTRQGMLGPDALVAAAVLVLPAFAMGVVVYCARRRSELGALLLGGALGMQIAPLSLAWTEAGEPGPASGVLLFRAAILIGMGGLLSAWTFHGGKLRPRVSVIALSAVLVAFGSWDTRKRNPGTLAIQAWTRFPRKARAAADTPEGQLLIFPGSPGVERVTLDHRGLTPSPAGAPADAELLRVSLSLLPEDVRERGARVLLVGQLSPGRSGVLADAGVTSIDRSAAWWRCMPWLETELFQGQEAFLPERAGMTGEVCSQTVARERLAAGEYDLVIVPPVRGTAPLAPHVEVPEGTLAVAWLDAQSPIARRRIEGPVLLSADGFEELSLGLVWGVLPESTDALDRPTLVLTGDPTPAPSILGWLRTRPEDRRRRSLVDICARLYDANASVEWSSLTAGLLRHYEGQVRSSPWGTTAQNTELVPEALIHLQEAALLREPDHFTRQVWNGLARILVGKRDVPGIYRWIEPVAGAWSPWIPGELALAHASVESLEPTDAVARLTPLADERPEDARLAEALAGALDLAGAHAAAAERWRVVLTHRPTDRGVLRALAVSLLDAGSAAEARTVLEQLSRAHPDDPSLPELLKRLEGAANGDD